MPAVPGILAIRRRRNARNGVTQQGMGVERITRVSVISYRDGGLSLLLKHPRLTRDTINRSRVRCSRRAVRSVNEAGFCSVACRPSFRWT